MRPTIVDFLNHGLLPFIGREEESQRILEFWHGEEEQYGLRALLLMGEAGSGKSRIIEELIPQIEQQGGLVLHLRLRADGSASIAPILGLAIGGSTLASRVLNGQVVETLPGAIGALRRLCRLRRTLLIVEDLHLLSGATVREFGMLVDAVADEPLALLAVSRPAELTARGALEAYLTSELHLQDLRPDDMQRLWKELFGNDASSDLITTLAETTLGNPLAFRSALQGALNAGAIGMGSHGWEATVPLEDLASLTEQSAHQLSQGMAAHLNDAERDVACRLATLGEVFSPEAAELLLPGTNRTVTALLFKGILIRSSTAVHPLRGGPAASLPLTFTHTLLHRTLLEAAAVDLLGLAQVIVAQPPIYSVLPYRLLADQPLIDFSSIAEAEKLINECLTTAVRLDNSPDWELATIPWRAAQQIILKAPLLQTPVAQQEFTLNLLAAHLSISGRNDDSVEFHQQAQALIDLASEPIADHLRPFRIRGYLYLFKSAARLRRSECPEIINAVETMVETWSELRHSREYAAFLRIVASTAYILGLHIQDLRYVEQAIQRVVAEQGNNPATQTAWLHDVGHHLLLAFTTPDELAERRKLLQQLEEAGLDNPRAYLRSIALHADTGAAHRAIAEIERRIPTLRDLGLLRTIYSAEHYRCQCLLLIGRPIEEVLQQARAIIAQVPLAIQRRHEQHMGEQLIACALLCGHVETAERLLVEFQLRQRDIAWLPQLLLACWSDNPAEALQKLEGIEAPIPDYGPDAPDATLAPLLPALAAVRNGHQLTQQRLEELLHLLNSPILRRFNLLSLYAAYSLGELLIQMELLPETKRLTEAMVTGIANALQWGKENNLQPVVLGIQQRYAWSYNQDIGWQTETIKADIIHIESQAQEAMPELQIGMFGSITLQHPNGTVERLRGTRNQITLCLLVADRMLQNPLSRNRFIEIASGVSVTDFPDKARRGMNMAILRLREAIGQQAINTDGETPQLNLAVVKVDLIEARETLQRMVQLTRRGALTEARQTLFSLLPLLHGGTPFTGVDDELFQNLRSQWEQELSNALEQLLQRLRNAGDNQEANLIESQLPEGLLA